MAKVIKVSTAGWALDDALVLIGVLQGRLWDLRHHVTLGGSVLNHGFSDKDLDLYVLPFGVDDIGTPGQVDGVLASVMVYERPIGSEHYPQQPAMRTRDRYTYDGKRVDVFVVKVVSAPAWVLELMGNTERNIASFRSMAENQVYEVFSPQTFYRFRILRKHDCVTFARFDRFGQFETHIWPDAPPFDPLAAYPVAEEGRRPDQEDI